MSIDHDAEMIMMMTTQSIGNRNVEDGGYIDHTGDNFKKHYPNVHEEPQLKQNREALISRLINLKKSRSHTTADTQKKNIDTVRILW
jgi:hypothetical protein